MRTTNFVLKAIFSVAVLSLSTLSLAHEDHHPSTTEGKNTSGMSQMDHSQHSAQEHEKHVQMTHSEHMNHLQVQSENTQQKDSTEKSQNKNAKKGDQHAHH